jgi:hypothetical protein
MKTVSLQDIQIEEPNWLPLEQRIGEQCADFMWMYAKDDVEYYKHIVTRRYLCLNSTGGVFLCIDGVLEPVEFQYGYAVATSGSANTSRFVSAISKNLSP